ncbi:hypothetical protein [Bradyrhizobium sp.]|jgi:hypothetical protein|uniref:hypothetical protein n=1 Tax=Bradyrhizobium sp. TaxID=376 RepID=UPI003BB1163E
MRTRPLQKLGVRNSPLGLGHRLGPVPLVSGIDPLEPAGLPHRVDTRCDLVDGLAGGRRSSLTV